LSNSLYPPLEWSELFSSIDARSNLCKYKWK